jgi:ribonuclease HI
VNCFRDRWWQKWLLNGWQTTARKPVLNRDLWEPLIAAAANRDDIAFNWVKGHSGHQMNDFVDGLAVAASQGL